MDSAVIPKSCNRFREITKTFALGSVSVLYVVINLNDRATEVWTDI